MVQLVPVNKQANNKEEIANQITHWHNLSASSSEQILLSKSEMVKYSIARLQRYNVLINHWLLKILTMFSR